MFDIVEGRAVEVFKQELRHTRDAGNVADDYFLGFGRTCFDWRKADFLVRRALLEDGGAACLVCSGVAVIPALAHTAVGAVVQFLRHGHYA